MRNLLMVVFAALCSLEFFSAHASGYGEKTIGILAGYNTQNESGISGISFQYRFSSHLRISPNFQYIFKKNDISAYELNINMHAPFRLDTRVNIYPIVGLTCQSWKLSHGDEDNSNYNKVGINAGAGIEYMATPSLKISLEGTYSWIQNYDSGNFYIGVGYLF